MMKKIGLLSIALVLGSTAAGRADVIRLICHRTSADRPYYPDPIEERFEIDTTRAMVTRIDGCWKQIYTNTGDDQLNGSHSKCPPSSDPLIRSLQTTGPEHDDATYYVRSSPERIEWGRDGRGSAASSEWDRRTNILSTQSICKSCVAITTHVKTYRCTTILRR